MEATETVDIIEPNEIVAKKAAEAIDFLKSVGWQPVPRTEPEPKTWFLDPYQLMDSVGLGYRHHPGPITFDTLQQMTERDPVVAAIIQTRIQQVASFARRQANKYSIGFKISPRDYTKRKLDDRDRKKIKYLENFILNTGASYDMNRDGFETFIKKFVRDRLTWDQATFEKVRGLPLDDKPGKLLRFYATPSATMRIYQPKNRRGTPPNRFEAEKQIQYVQVIDGKIATEYTGHQLAFCVSNPRSDLMTYKYGYTELEMLLNTVTAHLWAEEWNRKAFSQGSTIKGLLNVKGQVPQAQMESFKRNWALQVAGVQSAHKTPMINAEGIEWFPLQLSNTEMGYQLWLEYLIKVACAAFLMDPAEINFDLRGGAGVSQPMFMTTNEAQQKVSKDRGLRPLLRFVADSINRHVIWAIDDDYEFDFVGLDAKTEEQAIELRLKEVQNYKTINETREADDLPPIEDGDIILNPTFTGYKLQKASGGGAGGGMPGDPGGAAPGGMPGMPPGADAGAGGPPGPGGQMAMPGGGAPQPPPQLAEHRPNALMAGGKPKPNERTEQAAAQKLHNKAEKTEESSESSPGPDLLSESWEESVHASLNPKQTLRKSTLGDFFINVGES